MASRAKRAEPEAFGELFDLFFEKLRRFMYYHTGDLNAAEDLASEVFVKAMDGIDKFEDRGGTVGAWLFGIARNMLARHREAAGKASFVELGDDLTQDEDEYPEKLMLTFSSHEQLYDALRMLPDEQREIVLLRFMEGYDVKTVARITGKKPGNVRVLQYRAIGALRKMFESGESLS